MFGKSIAKLNLAESIGAEKEGALARHPGVGTQVIETCLTPEVLALRSSRTAPELHRTTLAGKGVAEAADVEPALAVLLGIHTATLKRYSRSACRILDSAHLTTLVHLVFVL